MANTLNIDNSGSNYLDKKIKSIVYTLSSYAMLIIIVSVIASWLFKKNTSDFHLLSYLPFFILTLILNKKGYSLLAFSLIFTYSAFILTYSSIVQGERSATHFHFANNILGLTLLYSNPNAKKHFYYSLIITISAILFVVISFALNLFPITSIDLTSLYYTRLINFSLLIFSGIVFSYVVASSFNYQKAELNQSINEQKTLLAEVNHRVKNNMAIIISLINLKRDQCSTNESKEALNDCKNRVMAMSLVHQKVYNSKNMVEVELNSYITELVNELKYSLDIKFEATLKVEVDKIKVDINNAIPLGLILNELITNSFKHAFNAIEKPEIKIAIQKTNEHTLFLTYRDNGLGKDDILQTNKDSLGVSLITALSEQLSGVPQFHNKDGLEFRLEFKTS